ncbi:unnamed protein product [Urochloa humidicola]
MPLVRTRCLLQLLLVVARATHLAIAERRDVSERPWWRRGSSCGFQGQDLQPFWRAGLLESEHSYCSWQGVTCGKRHQQRVVRLNLDSQGLIGTISPAIGNLTFLRSLNLSLNTLQGDGRDMMVDGAR